MTLTKQKPRRPSQHHRKVTGQHHNHQSRHYIKAYWPYLPVFAVLGLGLVLNSFIGRQHHSVLGYATSVSSQVLLAETNGERTSNSVPALQLNAQLTAAAQAKANDMAKRNYWSHVTPDGKQPWNFLEAAGYHYDKAGENLAYGFGTSDQVITAWMQSPEHKANLLNADYQEVGFATANTANFQGTGPETIVVAMYGQPDTSALGVSAQVNNPPAVAVSTAPQNVSRLQLAGNTAALSLGIAVLCGGALMLFFVRHARAWHRVLVRSEDFVLHHPFYDVIFMAVVVAGLLLSHAAGTIL